MPPRRKAPRVQSIRSRLQSHSQNIPIYQILTNKDASDPVSDILPRIQEIAKSDPICLKVSFLHMLVRLCGLGEYTSQLNRNQTLESLHDVLKKAEESKKASQELIILEVKSKFHKEFVKRVRSMLENLMGEDVSIMSMKDVHFNQSMLSWLKILTTSKMRLVRSSSFYFTKIFIEEQLKLVELSHKQKNSKKAFNMSKGIGYYLEQIVAERAIDIDDNIRSQAFKLIAELLRELESELLTQVMLQKLFGPLLEQNEKIVAEALRTLHIVASSCRNHKELSSFLVQHAVRLSDLSRSASQQGVQALKLIAFVNKSRPEVGILRKDTLTAALESYASHNCMYGLTAAVEVFYGSLYATMAEVEANSSTVLLELISLLLDLGQRKHLPLILGFFFNHGENSLAVFNIDNMFGLLMAEFFRNEHGVDTRLLTRELSMLMSIISQFITHCRQRLLHIRKDIEPYEKAVSAYNSHVLVHCKELFFQKITKHKELANEYLNLFACLHTPVAGSLDTYVDFVIEKSTALFCQELQDCSIYKQVVKLQANFGNQYTKALISKTLPENCDQINVFQVFKTSALLSQFAIPEVLNDDFLSSFIRFFAFSKRDKEKMEVLSICHQFHRWTMSALISDRSMQMARIYNPCRDKILSLFVQVLENIEESKLVKMTALNSLLSILKTICGSKIETASPKYCFHPSRQQLKIIYEFIGLQLFNSSDSSLDITQLMADLRLDNIEIKSQAIRNLFDLYRHSHYFVSCSQSVRFIVALIKGEHDMSSKELSKVNVQFTRLLEFNLNSLLENYANQQVLEINQGRLVFWRLAHGVLRQSKSDAVTFNACLQKLIKVYFKKKRESEAHKTQLNKLMLFMLEGVSRVIQSREYSELEIYSRLLKRVFRRFQKDALIRVKQALAMQVSEILEEDHVKQFKTVLEDIGKSSNKRSKKIKQNNPEQEQSQNSQNEEQEQEQEQERQKIEEPTVKKEAMEIEKVQVRVRSERLRNKSKRKSQSKRNIK